MKVWGVASLPCGLWSLRGFGAQGPTVAAPEMATYSLRAQGRSGFLGFRVFRVQGSGFRVWGLGFRV